MRSLFLLILLLLLGSTAHADSELPEIKNVRFTMPQISQGEVVYEVHFEVSHTRPFELSQIEVYVVDPVANVLNRLNTWGIMFSGDPSGGVEKSSASSPWRVSAGTRKIGTSITGAPGERPVPTSMVLQISSIKRGYIANQTLWCLEIRPSFRGMLTCVPGPDLTQAQNEAQRNAEVEQGGKDAKLAELRAASGPSLELCQFASAALTESLSSQSQCRVDCFKTHGGMSARPPGQASESDECNQRCSRVTPDQVEIVQRMFPVCDGFAPIEAVCRLSGKIAERCGFASTTGCEELVRTNQEKCAEQTE